MGKSVLSGGSFMDMDSILNSVGKAHLAPAGKIYIGNTDKKEIKLDVEEAKKKIAQGDVKSLNDAITYKGEIKIDAAQLKKASTNTINSQAATLELSDTKVIEQKSTVKPAGSVSPRETWENDAIKMKSDKQQSMYTGDDVLEIMRFDAPELYAKYMELWQKASDYHVHREVNVYTWVNDHEIDVEKYDDVDEETVRRLRETYKENCVALYTYDHSPESFKKAEPFLSEAYKLKNQWWQERCMRTGVFSSPVAKQFTAMDVLSKAYSDGKHDTSINFYSKGENTKPHNIFTGASLWRYSTKFNLLLTTDILNAIATGNKNTASSWMSKIADVMKDLRGIDKAYEGSHSYLRYGAIFDGDKVTYHANYADCDNKHGVKADTPEGLLRIINS